MQYEIYQPFYFRPEKGPNGEGVRSFWADVEATVPGLSRAIGIYVFTTCVGENYTPWYVGKTNAQAGFRGEIFQDHKLSHYVAASERKKGYPAIHFIAKVQPNLGNFCRGSKRSGREIEELETVIIGMALRANPNVRNSKKTWFNKTCQVPGIIGEPLIGRPPTGVTTLRNALKLA